MRLSLLPRAAAGFVLSASLYARATPAPPVEDFVRHGTLERPELSPDGQHLAVSVRDEKDNSYQVAVLHLPDLKTVSRLSMAPQTLPSDLLWVSNDRVVVSLATLRGALEAPSETGEIVSVDVDGTTKRTIYSARLRGSQTGTMLSKMSMMNLPAGFAAIGGRPDTPNAHFYMVLYPYNTSRSTSLEAYNSQIYDVDTISGAAKLIGEISLDGIEFVVHDGVARYAYGTTDKNENVVYYRDAEAKEWTKLDAAKIGKSFTPLRLSADGSKVYSLSNPDGGPNAFAISRLDGSAREVLASNPRVSMSALTWTPPPRQPIAALAFDGRPAFTYLSDNVHAKALKALNAQFPDHIVNLAGLSDDGNIALVVAANDRDPGTYALLDVKSMNLRPLYQTRPWLKPELLGERRPFRFKATSGTELMGILTLPPGGEAKRLPLVLLPHGGPIGIDDDWFYDSDSQFLATRGYVVLQVNYRGSGGRGENFEKSGYREMGTGMQQDIIDAVRWAIGEGIADPKRICVFGGSYGGYTALMQPIRAPDLYRCAISYAGVSDLRVQAERSDTRRLKAGRAFLDQAWNTNDDAYVKANSPIDNMDKFNVPVFIIHGEDDKRVPLQNAKRLRATLEKDNKPYDWLVEPNEGHGFYSEEHNTERYKRMEAFLKKFIDADAAGSPQK